MHQFIEGTDEGFEGLGIRAIGRCIRYRSQAMPPGCTPPRAHVGFEVNPLNNMAILYVEHGVQYTGNSVAVREWLRTGERRFANFDDRRRSIQEDLARAYGQAPAPTTGTAEPLTDFEAVSVSLNPKRAAYLDETEVFNRLARRVRGQDAALHSLVSQTCRHLAKPNPTRPAVFFAVGETGAGKTRRLFLSLGSSPCFRPSRPTCWQAWRKCRGAFFFFTTSRGRWSVRPGTS
jgi:hypothetical protein